MTTIRDAEIKAIILGHAIADAMGVPVEFMDRNELCLEPVIGYRGYGSHYVPAGTWSDDTSMTLATLDSLTNGLDYVDIMQKFSEWVNDAKYTATGEVFDIGGTTRKAIVRYMQGEEPLLCGGIGKYDNGNGSLMRIIPAVLYVNKVYSNESLEKKLDIIHKISALTHGHTRSMMGCGIYATVIEKLAHEKNKSSVNKALAEAERFYKGQRVFAEEHMRYERLFSVDFAELSGDEIKSSGYVVHTLEAAIWCILNTESYEECVLKAVNLGDDTDTVAAVTGGLAGALYGIEGIPEEWIDGLLQKEMIDELCEKFTEGLGNV